MVDGNRRETVFFDSKSLDIVATESNEARIIDATVRLKSNQLN